MISHAFFQRDRRKVGSVVDSELERTSPDGATWSVSRAESWDGREGYGGGWRGTNFDGTSSRE